MTQIITTREAANPGQWRETHEAYEQEASRRLHRSTCGLIATTVRGIEKSICPEHIADLNSANIKRFEADLRESGDSNSTVRRKMAVLRAMLNWAKATGRLTETPKFAVPPDPWKRKRWGNSRIPTAAEVAAAVTTAAGPTIDRDDPLTCSRFCSSIYVPEAVEQMPPSARKVIRQVAADVDRLLCPKSLEEIPDRLGEFKSLLRTAGYSPETIRNKSDHLRAMLSWCQRRGLLSGVAGDINGRRPPPAAIATAQAEPAPDSEWRAFRAAYEREVGASFTRRTQESVRHIVNELERIAAPSKPADLTPQGLSAYQSRLRESGVSVLTLKKKLGHVKAILRWAFRMGYIAALPIIDMPRRARGARKAKGRPLSDEEFSRMLAATVEIVGHARAPSWRHFLRGLFTSGLRLTEALQLSWDGGDETLRVDQSGAHITLRIPSECQKSGIFQEAVPVTPEFERLLMETPEQNRRGYVFGPKPQRVVLERLTSRAVCQIISAIGEAAGAIVGKKRGGKPKYASAHDLRRSMCSRWAHRVPALVLQTIARHANISTTRQYYIGVEAQETAALLWEADAAAGGKVNSE